MIPVSGLLCLWQLYFKYLLIQMKKWKKTNTKNRESGCHLTDIVRYVLTKWLHDPNASRDKARPNPRQSGSVMSAMPTGRALYLWELLHVDYLQQNLVHGAKTILASGLINILYHRHTDRFLFKVGPAARVWERTVTPSTSRSERGRGATASTWVNKAGISWVLTGTPFFSLPALWSVNIPSANGGSNRHI